jgi:uncharacterized protein YjbI with pentapeptide repeats
LEAIEGNIIIKESSDDKSFVKLTSSYKMSEEVLIKKVVASKICLNKVKLTVTNSNRIFCLNKTIRVKIKFKKIIFKSIKLTTTFFIKIRLNRTTLNRIRFSRINLSKIRFNQTYLSKIFLIKVFFN